MNKVELIGRLTADPQIKYTEKEVAYTRFSLAIDDGYKENKKTYFINAIAWGSRAETIFKYLSKGNRVGIVGHIQTGSYEKEDGTRGYTTDVYVEQLFFLEKKEDSTNEEIEAVTSTDTTDENDLPF